MSRAVAARSLLIALLALTAGCGGNAAVRTSPPPPTRPALPASSAPSSAPSTVSSTSTAPTPAPPTRPAAPRTSSRSVPRIPPVSARARAAGLRDIRTIVPDAIIDLRYATSDNFVGVRLYPRDARCLVHKSMAPGLRTAADRLRRQGYVLVFWDCYRPHPVQVHMFEIVPDPNWVARPGPYATSHEAGRSVDVTLARKAPSTSCPAARRVQHHCLLDMGTEFDDFTARAHAFATDGVSTSAQADRARLRTAMDAGGISVYAGEWWHFDGPGSGIHRPQLGAPLD
jgi:zinc D-Ala-D-Ala dipeptidase